MRDVPVQTILPSSKGSPHAQQARRVWLDAMGRVRPAARIAARFEGVERLPSTAAMATATESDGGGAMGMAERSRRAPIARVALVGPAVAALAIAGALAATPAAAEVPAWPTIGQREGEIDLDVGYSGAFGDAELSPRLVTLEDADVRVATVGAGYNVGRLGPLHGVYARVEAGSFTSAPERLALPVVGGSSGDSGAGTTLRGFERGAFVRGTTSAALIVAPRFSFGLFLEGTVPIGANLSRFSTYHFDWIAGGTNLDIELTDRSQLVHIAYRARFSVGSGAYDDDSAVPGQSNARATLTNLLRFEADRWLLPWPVGVTFGPQFSGDLNEYVDHAVGAVAGLDDASLATQASVRRLAVDMALMPYVHLTKHVAVELAYVHTLFGVDLGFTRQWSASLRTTF